MSGSRNLNQGSHLPVASPRDGGSRVSLLAPLEMQCSESSRPLPHCSSSHATEHAPNHHSITARRSTSYSVSAGTCSRGSDKTSRGPFGSPREFRCTQRLRNGKEEMWAQGSQQHLHVSSCTSTGLSKE